MLVVDRDPANDSVQCFVGSAQFAVHDYETVRLIYLVFKNCILVIVFYESTDFRLLLLGRTAFR